MRRMLRGFALAAASALVARAALKWVYDRIDKSDAYLFDPEELQKIADVGAGLPMGERWAAIHKELVERYPGKVAPEVRWTFNSAGNVVCQIAIVYASPTEYVAFFGTPIGATGFSGRYRYADVWDLMVDGRMITCTPGQMEPTEYGPGDSAYLPKGTVKLMTYVGSTWMIDYGRGLPLAMVPFGITNPAAFSTLDFRSAGEQLVDYGRLVLRSMLGSGGVRGDDVRSRWDRP